MNALLIAFGVDDLGNAGTITTGFTEWADIVGPEYVHAQGFHDIEGSAHAARTTHDNLIWVTVDPSASDEDGASILQIGMPIRQSPGEIKGHDIGEPRSGFIINHSLPLSQTHAEYEEVFALFIRTTRRHVASVAFITLYGEKHIVKITVASPTVAMPDTGGKPAEWKSHRRPTIPETGTYMGAREPTKLSETKVMMEAEELLLHVKQSFEKELDSVHPLTMGQLVSARILTTFLIKRLSILDEGDTMGKA
ncbi:hypothetical protein GGR50DRAFT_696543 [Xylaria sp. CBS 124048]|nr:hypothetical protein GGR50DRAFT_696543 [Xylaria sp. CBS 124048]